MHQSDRGASAVEYGLMIAAIAGVIVALVFGLGLATSTLFSKTSDCFQAGVSATC